MIYRARKNGFKAEDFHRECDNQGATLIIILSRETEGYGGLRVWDAYTDIPWTSAMGYKPG